MHGDIHGGIHGGGRVGGPPEGLAVTPESASPAERAALRALQVGAIAVVIVASTNREFELDRFFVPKELVLHLTAVLGGALAVGRFRRLPITPVDLLLLAYLLFGAASAVMAPDPVLGARALAISVSGVVLFWAARAVADAGLARPLLAGFALAVVIGCVGSLLQAYGVETEIFSTNRAPGGTLGNRNFVAHLAALGLPLVLLCALSAWRAAGYLLWTGGTALVVGTLVLTRSRAGWLAAVAALLVVGAALLISPALRRHGRSWRRVAGILALAAAGIAGSLLLPNTLRWRSDNPYLESVRDVANYQEGSGRGRLVQYERSLRIAADRPVLGAGPGNWPLVYPDYAAEGDPSLDRGDPSTTANPWPSSDWVAFVSERGVPATALLGLALLALVVSAGRRVARAPDVEKGLAGAAVVATIVGTVVAGMFDAVLLLAQPTLIVWSALGALTAGGARMRLRERGGEPPSPWGAALLIAWTAVAALGALLGAVRLATII